MLTHTHTISLYSVCTAHLHRRNNHGAGGDKSPSTFWLGGPTVYWSPQLLVITFSIMHKTDAQATMQMICDVLLRLNLPISMLRGQTYDGASNMAGKFNGTQALIAGKQPLAIYVHCLMHCGNLAAQSALESAAPIRDAISTIIYLLLIRQMAERT